MLSSQITVLRFVGAKSELEEFTSYVNEAEVSVKSVLSDEGIT